ncbi:MAG: sugar ABC transporter permease [Tepidisphaeraceae bacterium]
MSTQPSRDRLWTWQHRWAPGIFLLPFLILLAVFILYPLTQSLILSFYKTAGPGHRVFVGLENFRYLIGSDLAFDLAVINTTAFTALCLAIEIPLALGLAMLLNSRRLRWRGLFRFAFFASYLVGQVYAAVLFFQIFSERGLVNRGIRLVAGHSTPIPWLRNPNLVLPSILIAALWLTTGYAMIYLLAALQAVDRELYDAAEVDGAGRWESFWHITLPGIRPVLSYLILVGTILGFQLFELPYVLFQGPGPNGRGLTIVMYLFLMGFGTGDLGYASAIGWTLVIILLIVSLAQWRIWKFAVGGEA